MAAVLVAEDDRALSQVIKRGLEVKGHAVTVVEDGIAALKSLGRNDFDVVLADIVMPEMDGIALALKVSKDFPATPILLMSGYAEERERAHNLDALISDVVTKPFTLESLTASIDRALAFSGAGGGN